MLFFGICMIIMRNPIHSVVSLIIICLNIINFLLVLGANFMGVMLLLVYVGAVVVLFLFVVMLINVRIIEKLRTKLSYVPLGMVLGLILGIELVGPLSSVNLTVNYYEWVNSVIGNTLLDLMGFELYTLYADSILVCGVILLIGIIGSLVITRKESKKK
jgi:NADH-quinone oxidoreductase subunit J